jgi:hypothetical protein
MPPVESMSWKRFASTLILFLLLPAPRVSAQTGASVTGVEVSYRFGEEFTISGRVAPGTEFKSIDLQIAFPGDPRILSVPIRSGTDGAFTFTHLIADRFVRAFSTVSYEFVLTGSDDEVTTDGPYSFFYADNRFDWQELADEPVSVHWYAGDAAYARQVLDAALDGLARSQAMLDHAPLPIIEIYAYATLDDYQFARGQFGQTWSGGHTDPSTGIVLAALPPGPEVHLEIERKVPHEVAHVSLFNAVGAGFWNLPVWLNEGYASILETIPNPDYDFLVSTAIAGEGLIPLADLCVAFPRDASGALLAYAESTSVVRYVDGAYGPAGLRALIDAYAAGASCEQGPLVEPIGQDLAGLEQDWLAVVQAGPDPAASREVDPAVLGPLLVIFAAVILGPGLVLIGSGLRRGLADDGK